MNFNLILKCASEFYKSANSKFFDLEQQALKNKDFRRIIYTGLELQITLMNIPFGEDVGMEKHKKVEQILFFVEGTGEASLNGKKSKIKAGDVAVVSPGTQHNFTNTGKNPLKLFSIYSPPNHLPNRIQSTKAEALADREDEEFGQEANK